MHQRCARGYYHPVQPLVADILLDQVLTGVGAHVGVIPSQRDTVQPPGELGDSCHVHFPGDVGAAVADVDSRLYFGEVYITTSC
jgi:hypothetical protein